MHASAAGHSHTRLGANDTGAIGEYPTVVRDLDDTEARFWTPDSRSTNAAVKSWVRPLQISIGPPASSRSARLATLWQIFEGIVSDVNAAGQAVTSFAQVSRGCDSSYNPNNPAGTRLIPLNVSDADVNVEQTYNIVTLETSSSVSSWGTRAPFGRRILVRADQRSFQPPSNEQRAEIASSRILLL